MSEKQVAEGVKKATAKRGSKTGFRQLAVAREWIALQEGVVTDASGMIFRYRDGAWSPIPDIAVEQQIIELLPKDQVTDWRKAVVKTIKADSYVDGLTWARCAVDEVAAANGVIDVMRERMRPHRPDDYLERVLPVAYDPWARCPTWLSMLGDAFERSADQLKQLQEFFGYVVLPHAKFKKALMLYGRSNSGKSVVLQVARMLVGDAYCCQLDIQAMGDPMLRAQIRGKALNVLTELPINASVPDGIFKQLVSTEEPILIEQKYYDAVMYVPTAKHLVATNHLPHFSDASSAMFNRLLIVGFTQVIPEEQQDPLLPEKLREELPGILNWALEGARRLIAAQGRFSGSVLGDKLISEYRDEINPMRRFFAERLVPERRMALPLGQMLEAYNRWNRGAHQIKVGRLRKLIDAYAEDAGIQLTIKNVRFGPNVHLSLVGFDLGNQLNGAIEINEEDAAL